MTVKIVLQDAFKKFTDDQDKVLPPEETVRRLRERLATLDLKILDHTRRIDSGRLGIPVYFSRCGADAEAITGTKKQMGKGATPAQAEASAVMELAERFSFFSFCNTPGNFIVDTWANLKDRAIPFEMIARSVHDESADLAVTRQVFETLPMRWTWAYNLTRERAVLVPFDWFFAINEFNGPSAGNCTEEAISQGICEVVERHVSALVSHGRISVPAIDPATATDPAVREMIAKYEVAGVKLFLSDFTLATGIPTVGAMGWDPSTFPEKSEIVWTAGTTPSPEKALSRALTEVAQLAGDFNTGASFVASGLPKYRSMEEARYVTDPEKTVSLQALPDLSDNNIRVEIENMVRVLAAADMEVLLIDTMHPGLRVPAFYTIIPGAHFRERAIGTSVGMFAAKLIAENHPPQAAMAQLSAMAARLPGKYYLQFYLGLCHSRDQNPEAALSHFGRALDLEPPATDAASICSYMGACLKDQERYDEALEVLEKGLAADAERTDILNLMGFCHFKQKAHEAAIDCFRKILALDPSSAIDYANIASNYRDMGNREKAIDYYEMALALDPTIEFAADNLTRLQQGS
ncbi:MAG: YcaO-like family protein [Desulfobacterales bacterium]|nr:YcaO-like family protein [Desulfobacterales bacterium]